MYVWLYVYVCIYTYIWYDMICMYVYVCVCVYLYIYIYLTHVAGGWHSTARASHGGCPSVPSTRASTILYYTTLYCGPSTRALCVARPMRHRLPASLKAINHKFRQQQIACISKGDIRKSQVLGCGVCWALPQCWGEPTRVPSLCRPSAAPEMSFATHTFAQAGALRQIAQTGTCKVARPLDVRCVVYRYRITGNFGFYTSVNFNHRNIVFRCAACLVGFARHPWFPKRS